MLICHTHPRELHVSDVRAGDQVAHAPGNPGMLSTLDDAGRLAQWSTVTGVAGDTLEGVAIALRTSAGAAYSTILPAWRTIVTRELVYIDPWDCERGLSGRPPVTVAA